MGTMIAAEVLLLDMGGTFMFDCDRFSNADDLHRSYRALGGCLLTGDRIHTTMRELIDHMDRLAIDEAWQDEFPSIGEALAACGVVFSSDHRSVKPSPRLFEFATQQLDVGLDRIAFVGNDLRCDVGGARAVGLKSVWINANGRARGAGDPTPDMEVRDLGELVAQ